MDMEIFFPGNKKVHAEYDGFVIETDQPVENGGDRSAPAPFDLFIASIGTCAGIYVLTFLTQRGLPTEGVRITLTQHWDDDNKLMSEVSLNIKLPAGFPQKYHKAVVRAAEQCTVKRHFDAPPVFETYVTAD